MELKELEEFGLCSFGKFLMKLTQMLFSSDVFIYVVSVSLVLINVSDVMSFK